MSFVHVFIRRPQVLIYVKFQTPNIGMDLPVLEVMKYPPPLGHLEVTGSQTAEEFQSKLNAFITRKTRPKLLISDNAPVFKTTANWIKKIRKSEQLQNYLAKQEISWNFNLSKSPWWGSMYERLIKDLKRALFKTVRKSLLSFNQLKTVGR